MWMDERSGNGLEREAASKKGKLEIDSLVQEAQKKKRAMLQRKFSSQWKGKGVLTFL